MATNKMKRKHFIGLSFVHHIPSMYMDVKIIWSGTTRGYIIVDAWGCGVNYIDKECREDNEIFPYRISSLDIRNVHLAFARREELEDE